MSKKVNFEIFSKKIAPFGKNWQDVIRDMLKSEKNYTGGQIMHDRRRNRHRSGWREEDGI